MANNSIKKHLTLAELREQGPNEPIWVLNTTPDIPAIGQYADVILPIRNATGDPSRITVGVTWLPTELTAQVPRHEIVADANFLKYLRDGTLTLVTREWAENELSRKDAKIEQARLDDLDRSHQRAAEMMASGEDGPTRAETGEAKPKPSKSKVSVEFISWADRGAQLADTNLLNSLRLRRKFTRAELLYLRKAIGDKPLTQEAIRARLDAKNRARDRRRGNA